MLFQTIINHMQKKIPVTSVSVSSLYDISDVALLDGTQTNYRNHILYFGYYRQIKEKTLPPQCILASESFEEISPADCCSLAVIPKQYLFLAFNLSRSLVDTMPCRSLRSELLETASSDRNILTFLNTAATRLGNSLVLLDTNFRIVEHSTIFPVTDPIWANNIKQGFCSYDFIRAVQTLETVKNAPNTSQVVEVTCFASPMRKFSSKIFHEKERIGILLMLEKETPVTPVHLEMLRIVSSAAAEAVERYAPYLLPRTSDYQIFLYNLLIGASPGDVRPQMQNLYFSPHLCALVLKTTRHLGQSHLRDLVTERLKGLLPGTHVTYHKNMIAAVVPLRDAPKLNEEQLKNLESFAKTEFLVIGISTPFDNINNFPRQYQQALRALELNQQMGNKQTVCCYETYSFYDLLSLVKSQTSLGTYCHPALSQLSRYDHANGTDLYHTLRTYLEKDCSIKDTAEALYIHRNSLTYRLERIQELTAVSLSNRETRFLLSVSYQIDHYLGQDC